MPALASAQEGGLQPLREAVQRSPRDAEAQRAFGLALLRAGRLDEAERHLERAVRLQKGSLPALYDRARVAFARERYRPARAVCARLKKADPDAALTHVCMARAFLVWRRAARAFEHLEKALSRQPEHPQALLALGDAHRQRGELEDSIEAYRRAAEAATSARARARAWLGVGTAQQLSGRPGQAEAALRQALALDGDSPDIQLALGRVLEGEPAVRLLQQAAAGRPRSARVQHALGDALLEAGEPEAAQQALQKALALQEHLLEARVALGRAQWEAGRPADAEQTLREALERLPNDYDATMTLAGVLAERGRHEEAFEHYSRATGLRPRDPAAAVTAARLAMSQGRDVLAAGYLDRALAAKPAHGPALALYGDVMREQREPRRAREYYERALKAGGDVDPQRIRKRLAELSE